MMTAEQHILKFPREIKIQCLKDALSKDDIRMFFILSNFFLKYSINEGGLETEVIEQIHKEHLEKL